VTRATTRVRFAGAPGGTATARLAVPGEPDSQPAGFVALAATLMELLIRDRLVSRRPGVTAAAGGRGEGPSA
jgi:hypothetical protein